MTQFRVISFIDGFNLYHAISSLHRPELKWVDVRTLSKAFLRPVSENLLNVFYFSAYADHVATSVASLFIKVTNDPEFKTPGLFINHSRILPV